MCKEVGTFFVVAETPGMVVEKARVYKKGRNEGELEVANKIISNIEKALSTGRDLTRTERDLFDLACSIKERLLSRILE